eukprot:sb/3479060/
MYINQNARRHGVKCAFSPLRRAICANFQFLGLISWVPMNQRFCKLAKKWLSYRQKRAKFSQIWLTFTAYLNNNHPESNSLINIILHFIPFLRFYIF